MSLEENQRYQGSISCKDGHNKGQKQYGPAEAEDTKKRWQEYTEELYKNYIHDTDNHDDVITHLKIFIYLKVIVIYYKTLCMFVLYFSNLL